MSWLNSSLNTLKGQLTNLAQEVLAETAGPGDDDYRDPELSAKGAVELLAETQQQKEQLDRACEDKDREIAALRKQITKLQKSKKISDSGGGDTEPSATRPKSRSDDQQNASAAVLEDSWCWEPDNAPVTASATPHSSGDLVDVALSSKSDAQVAALEARIAQLEQQNDQLNASLEELDAQHEQAMQDVLKQKTQQQTQMQTLTQSHTELKQQQADSFIAHELALAKLQRECAERQAAQEAAVGAQQALQQRVDAYAEELKRSVSELADLQELLEKRQSDNVELIERVKVAEAAVEGREELQLRVQQLLKELEELSKQQQAKEKEKKTSESSTSSSTGKQSEDEFIVVRDPDATGSSSDPTTPPSKEKLRDKLVALEARIAELTLENGSLALKLQDRDLEKQLSSNVLGESLQELEQSYERQREQLEKIKADAEAAQQALTLSQTQGGEEREQAQKCVAELQSRLLISESEKEQLQLELQTLRNDWERKIQQLTMQNQELKLNAEAEAETQETRDDDVERLRELNQKLRQDLDASIAQAKFRQAIAEEKQEITDLDEADDAAAAAAAAAVAKPFDVEQLRQLLAAQLEGRLDETPVEALERAYRAICERWQRVAHLEQRLAHSEEEMNELQDRKLIAQHEKKTLEADISQYILQCDELMKNNEVLLNELEKFKRHKLETIEEHHEETIVQLEAQLEEATRRYRQLQGSENEVASELREVRGQLERKEEQLRQLKEQATESEEELQASEAQMTQLRVEMEAKEAQLKAEMELKEQQLRMEMEARQEQLEQLEEEATSQEESEIKIKQIKAEVAKKEAQLRAELAAQEQQLKSRLAEEEQHLKAELAAKEEAFKTELAELEKALRESQTQLAEIEAERGQKDENDSQDQSQALAELQKTIETLGYEKTEMIKALQQKHAENTQYYAEIQRLQPLAMAAAAPCHNCPNLEAQLVELAKEQEKLRDQIGFLKEKSDILTTNLLTEQSNQRLVQQERSEALEQKAQVLKDSERLRAHLLEIEELHTQETVELQQELQLARSQLANLQQEVSQSSNAYTSASIRANQQAETLQAQHGLLLQQRDELLAKLGHFEDRELKQQAALTNLQCALEQFQNDKEHDIRMATQRIRRDLQSELDRQSVVQAELAALQQQLADANQGLRAAARLSDQLEACQQTIAVLRDEVDSLKEHNAKLEASLNSSESSQTDKIEKSLIKSLLIGYVVSGHAGDKQQVLRMISSVLDFNAQESDRVGLNKPQGSWLGAILGGGGGPQTAGAAQGQAYAKDNLVQAFVQFLEQESQPKSQQQSRPTLLSMSGQTEAAAPAATPAPTSSSSSAVTQSADEPMRRSSQGSSSGSGAPSASASTSGSPPAQPLLISSNEFVPARNSSSILKDILSDS